MQQKYNDTLYRFFLVFHDSFVFLGCFLFLIACSNQQKEALDVVYQQTKWTQLIPEDDLDAILNPPEYLLEIEDGSLEDQIDSQLKSEQNLYEDERYQQALNSKRIIEKMNQQDIKIPGFIVPLSYDEKQNIIEFFIVPYFGACIHIPPPPPNQIIHVIYPQGFQLDNWNLPFWFSGKLNTHIIENELAISAYSLDVVNIEIYEDE